MTVLIVDDERPVVQATAALLAWEALGFAPPLCAYSMEEAQEILRVHPVDVMICDIEMPGGNGIALTQWAGAAYPALQTILLTAHERFAYARQAVSLGVLEYLLKPVTADELAAAVSRAAARAVQARETSDYIKYGDLWLHNQQLVSERFWLDVVNGIIPPGDIERFARDRNIPYQPGEAVLPVLLRLRGTAAGGGRPAEQQAADMLREALGPRFAHVNLLLPGSDWVCAVAWQPRGRFVAEDLNGLVEAATRRWGAPPSVYIGERADAQNLAAAIRQLAQKDQDNVLAQGGLIQVSVEGASGLSVPQPDYRLWAAMLREGQRQPLWDEIDSYHTRVRAYSGIDARFMLAFHHDFLQMVYGVLEEQGIPSHSFLESVGNEKETATVKDLSGLFLWAKTIVKAAVQWLEARGGGTGVMARLDHYIQTNLANELARDELAAQVHLNPDYLSRLVKKETGMPLSEYVQSKRMQMAQSLLAKTRLPVSEVALSVGYHHFSQFSKMFQKHVGQSPKQYRQSSQKQP